MLFPSTRRGAWLLLLALGVPTAWLAHVQAGTPIDPRNRAMKSATGADAAAIARRVALFGDDRALLAGFHPRSPDLTFAPADAELLARLARTVGGVDGVHRVEQIPAPTASERLWLIHLAAANGGAGDELVVATVEGKLREGCPTHLAVDFTGLPAVEAAIAAAVTTEQRQIVPAIAGALFVLLAVLFRSVGAAVAAMLPAGIAIACAGGVFALTGHRLDPVAGLLQPVLLTVGVAYSVHVVEGCRARAARMGPGQAVRRTVRDLLEPSLLATGTTVLGLIVNALSPIPSVVDFAVYAGFGVAVGMAAVFWVSPAVLLAWPGALAARPRGSPTRARGLTGFSRRHAASILTGSVLSLGFAVDACLRLTVDNDPLRILPAAHGLRVETERLAGRLGGVEPFDVLVPAGSALMEPAALRMLAADLGSRAGVVGLAGPPIQAATGDVLLRAILPRAGSTERGRVFDDFERSLRCAGHPEVLVTGSAVQVARDSNRLVAGQIGSLAITLVVLFVAMLFGLRSFRLSCIGLAPSVLTSLVVYGTLGALHRPLSVATALIGSVMLGLIVDTTIHLLVRFRRARAHGATRAAAVASALARAGRAVVLTSLVLGTGFSVAGFGRLSTTAEFGLLAALTIGVAAVVSLLLVPALLLVREGGRR